MAAGFQSVVGGLFGDAADTSDEGLEKMFNSIDKDSSGKISDAEMKESIKKGEPARGSVDPTPHTHALRAFSAAKLWARCHLLRQCMAKI